MPFLQECLYLSIGFTTRGKHRRHLNHPGLGRILSHLFAQVMCRGEDEGISLAEELDPSHGIAAAPATTYVAHAEPRQLAVLARRCARSGVLFAAL